MTEPDSFRSRPEDDLPSQPPSPPIGDMSRQPWRPAPTAGRAVGATIGTVLAVVLVIAGLVVVGLAILFVVAMNNFGSNK